MAEKAWPSDGKPAAFCDIVEPLISAFNEGATWRPKTSATSRDIEWTGLPLESSSLGPIDARLSAAWRENDRENDRTFLCTILGIAVNLGMEQGRRLELDRQEAQRDLLRASIDQLQYVLERWQGDEDLLNKRSRRIATEIAKIEMRIAEREVDAGILTMDKKATGA